MNEFYEYIGDGKVEGYPPDRLVQAAIHLLTGMSIHQTHRQTGVDKITLHWMSCGAWHKEHMLHALHLCYTHKVAVKASRVDAIQ